MKKVMNNTVRKINVTELLKSKHNEGLILRGCDGDPMAWIDLMNEQLEQMGAFSGNARFGYENCFVFNHLGITCILFEFKNVKIDIAKVAKWRICTRQIVNGTWLSDFISNAFTIGYHEVLEKYILPQGKNIVCNQSEINEIQSWIKSQRNNA